MQEIRGLVDRLANRVVPFNLSHQGAETWDARARAAARLFAAASTGRRPSPTRIVDIGCGNQRLHPLLEAELGKYAVVYSGFDLHPQAPDVTALDVSVAVPRGEWDAAFTLGVLEYIDDIHAVLRRLASVAPWYVLSHVVADSGAYDTTDVSRLGWRRLPAAQDWTSTLTEAGLDVVERRLIDNERSGLWVCRRAADG